MSLSPRSWQRLRRLPPAERRLLLTAVVALPAAALALRLRGLAAVQAAIVGRWPAPDSTAAHGEDHVPEAMRTAELVDAAARRGPWPANCLQRSIVLWGLLRHGGVASDLRIGVRRAPGSTSPDFHAWIELGDHVLNEQPDIRARYVTFDRPIAPRAAAFN